MILLVLDANNSNTIIKSYIYANGQVLMQHNGNHTADKYFYLHDRLGSVREIIDANASITNCYYYNPFGDKTGSETHEHIDNWFGWAGYCREDELDGYYCNARNYYQGRFMTRDPVFGQFEEPMTLHLYLYCQNEPINRIDPWGLLYIPPSLNNNINNTKIVIDSAINFCRERTFPTGPLTAFSFMGYEYCYKRYKYTFQISKLYEMQGGDFTNWLTGYTCTYLYGSVGIYGSRTGGHAHSLLDLGQLDDEASRYFLSGGILMGAERRRTETGRDDIDTLDYLNAKIDLAYGLKRITLTDITSSDFDKELELYLTFQNSGR